jgi:hypothetical protein
MSSSEIHRPSGAGGAAGSSTDPEKSDISHVERTLSSAETDTKQDHMDYNRVDSEVAKYTSETAVEISEAESNRLRKMIDKRILVVMICTYFLQALDKGTMSFASIMGIQTDAGLVGQQVCLHTPLLFPLHATRRYDAQ